MKPFRLVDARSAAHAVELLAASGPAAQPIAAGGDLLDLLKEGVEGRLLPLPDILVNLATARDLAGVSRVGSTLRLGSMTTLADLAADADLQAAAPMMVEAIARIASPQLRNVTTVAGNLLQRPRCLYFRHPLIDCFKKGGDGCPAATSEARIPRALFGAGPCRAVHPSDLATVLVALDAQLEVIGSTGPRTIRMESLYDGAERNAAGEAALDFGEIVTAILLRVGRPSSQAFEKAMVRGANEFAMASAAVAIDVASDVIRDCRVVLGGIALRPVRCVDAERLAVGRRLHEIEPASVADMAMPSARHLSDGAGVVTVAHALVSRAVARVVGMRQP